MEPVDKRRKQTNINYKDMNKNGLLKSNNEK